MDINYITELALIMKEVELAELEYKEGDSSIRLTKNNLLKQNNLADDLGFKKEINKNYKVKNIDELKNIEEDKNEKNKGIFDEKNTTIISSMVGTFYSKPSKDQPPFVSIGDEIKNGSTICIIEAMKLMNEIKAEKDYKVLDILVKDGEVVEYGQDLFVVREV